MTAETGNTVTIRYWAAAREAAGIAEETVRADTLADALREIRTLHADRPRFDRVLGICSILVNEAPVGKRDPAGVVLPAGAHVEVLPPYAGG
jgi:molybdopterin synthase sulfur carrier subunit